MKLGPGGKEKQESYLCEHSCFTDIRGSQDRPPWFLFLSSPPGLRPRLFSASVGWSTLLCKKEEATPSADRLVREQVLRRGGQGHPHATLSSSQGTHCTPQTEDASFMSAAPLFPSISQSQPSLCPRHVPSAFLLVCSLYGMDSCSSWKVSTL